MKHTSEETFEGRKRSFFESVFTTQGCENRHAAADDACTYFGNAARGFGSEMLNQEVLKTLEDLRKIVDWNEIPCRVDRAAEEEKAVRKTPERACNSTRLFNCFSAADTIRRK